MNGITVKQGRALTSVLWPEFKVVGDCVFLETEWKTSKHLYDPKYRMQSEVDINHVHVLECFTHGASSTRAPFYKTKHPDFVFASDLGRAMCQMWAAKLAIDLPKSDFRVYFHGLDPIVRFHKIRRGEGNWIETKDHKKEIRSGKLLILDTREILKAQQAT